MKKHCVALFALISIPLASFAAEETKPEIALNELYSQERSGAWVYLPAGNSSAKLPCVVVPPAGSRLFHGMSVGQGDRNEHIPYVKAGFAVITFDISGDLPDAPSAKELRLATARFAKSRCGTADAIKAIDAALKAYPQIDPARLYVAGHSSAGTLALQVAAVDPRIKGCIAYAPVVDLKKHLGAALLKNIAAMNKDLPTMLADLSPCAMTSKIKCPVMLFSADDDTNVSARSVAAFKDELGKSNPTVVHVSVPSGGHYDSMIKAGIPKGIAWLRSLEAPAPQK